MDAEEYREESIRLPKSRLLVEDGVLRKLAPDGSAIGRHKLEDITDVLLVKDLSPGVITFIVVCAVLSWAAKMYIPHELWSWVVSIFLVLVTLFSFFIIKVPRLKVVFRDDEVAYELSDQADENQSFTITLKELLREHRSGM